MDLSAGDQLAGVEICTESDDVLLTTAQGQAIRFATSDVRLFQSRNSTGVRGIRLAEGDLVISMSILRHVEATTDERVAYLKIARAVAGEEAENGSTEEEPVAELSLSQERYAEMGAAEQFILTVSARGFGKRTSSYEFRITNRGGKGITAMIVNERNGPLVASFPVEETDQIMLVTDNGQLIRCPVHDIRKAGRNVQGVTIFKTAGGEQVVAVERISEEANEEEEGGEGEAE